MKMVLELRARGSPATKTVISRVARQLGVGRRVAAHLGEAGRGGRRQAARAHDRGAGRAEAAPQGELRAATVERHPAVGSGFLRGGARPPRKEIVAYIDAHRDNTTDGRRWGVEPICAELQVAPSTYYDAKARPPSERAVRDAELGPAAAGAVGEELLRLRTPQALEGGPATGHRRRAGPGGPAHALSRASEAPPGRRSASPPRPTRPPPGPGPREPRLHRHPARRACGSPTSPTARPGRASSTSPSSSTSSPAGSSAGRRPAP